MAKTKRLPKLTAKRLTAYTFARAMIRCVLEEPKRLEMWHYDQRRRPKSEDGPACGTTACLAGWGQILATGYANSWAPDIMTDLLIKNDSTYSYWLKTPQISRLKSCFYGDLGAGNPRTLAYARSAVKPFRAWIKRYEKRLKARVIVRQLDGTYRPQEG